MRRMFLFVLFALTMAGGVASADRYHHRGHHHGGLSVGASFGGPYGGVSFGVGPHGGVSVGLGYSGGYYGSPYYGSHYGSPYARVVRRPIYVRAPVVPYHYYDYYRRPALLVEHQRPIVGYLWVPGQWQWNGYEWLWRSGHYTPDPEYGAYQGYESQPGAYNSY
jgi:hypothetical protein